MVPSAAAVIDLSSRRRLVIGIAALLLTGSLGFFLSPPRNWAPLQLVIWVPALLVFRRLDGARAFFAGWLVGATINMLGFAWIPATVDRFTNLPPPSGLVVLAAFGALFGFATGVLAAGVGPIARVSGRAWPVAVAAWAIACEYLNPQLFPWTHGVVWYRVPEVFLTVAFGGTAFVGFVVLLLNATLAAAAERAWNLPGRAPGAATVGAACTAALLVFTFVYSHHREGVITAAEDAADSLRIGLVQSNRDVFDQRALRKEGRSAVTDDQVALSEEALLEDGDIDALIWPEGAIARHPTKKRNRSLLRLARDHGVEVWLGAIFRPTDAPKTQRRRPGAFRIGPDGRVAGRYDKVVLLPFGEYMPLAETFPILKKIEGVHDMRPGDDVVVFEDAPAAFSFLICYEATRPRFVRRGARAGTELLVNITYDGWFGDTTCPHQHLMLAAAQAASAGIPMVRSATTGISAVIDARGTLVQTTEPFTRDVLVADVKPFARPSLFVAWGDWVAHLCTFVTLLLFAAGAIRERATPAAIALVVLAAAAPLTGLLLRAAPPVDRLLWALAALAALVALVVPRLHPRSPLASGDDPLP